MDEKDLLKKIKEQVKELVGDKDEQIENIKKEYADILEKAKDDLISKEDLNKALQDLTAKTNDLALSNEKVEQLVKDVNDIGLKIQSMQEQSIKQSTGRKSFREIIEDGLKAAKLIKEVKEGEDELKQIHYLKEHGAKTTPLIELKSAVDMTTALSYADVEVGSPFKTQYDPSMVQIPLNNDIHTTQIFPVMNIGTKYMGILVETTYTDGSATTDENTAAGKSSVLFKTEEFKAFKINTYFHISEEQLDDVDYLLDELSRLAPDKILTKWDSKVLSASGDGSSDIKGLFVSGNYTAFADDTTYANTVENATAIDLIGKMKLQAEVANYSPNFVLMHPQFRDEIEGLKDLNENSLFNRNVKYDENGNLAFVKGLRVVINKNMGTDTVLVGRNESAKIGIRKDMSMQIGLDSDDLTTGMRTVVFSLRGAFGVREAGAMIYEATAATAITNINKS